MEKMRGLGPVAVGALLALPGVVYADGRRSGESEWTTQGLRALEAAKQLAEAPKRERAKNVIVFVGDGMGISTQTAARILEGQRQGHPGEENRLAWEKFPHLATVKTYSVNQQTSDSAPTMTAIITGVKTKDGVLSINENVVRGDPTTVKGNELISLIELAEDRGLSTGVVSTARITHATPAACYAHSPERDWESDAELNDAARAAGFPDIARQLIENPHGDGLEVALGGGREYFLPATLHDPEDEGAVGRRKDGRDLTLAWQQKRHGAYVWNKQQFDAVDPQRTERLLGLFERSHMEYEADRAKDKGGEPSLAEMTAKAIALLGKNDRGYVLMVEAGRVDHAHHAGNARRALEDAIALSDAVKLAAERTDPRDTQILLTSDHSHVFTIAGYPARGNDILGKVVSLDVHGELDESYALAGDELPYTTLGYTNGPGHRSEGRPDLTQVDTGALDFLQEATVPLSSETHGGEDVALYARGPSAHLVHGNQEQTIAFYVAAHALGFDAPKGEP